MDILALEEVVAEGGMKIDLALVVVEVDILALEEGVVQILLLGLEVVEEDMETDQVLEEVVVQVKHQA